MNTTGDGVVLSVVTTADAEVTHADDTKEDD
jgi:hypothetical protein